MTDTETKNISATKVVGNSSFKKSSYISIAIALFAIVFSLCAIGFGFYLYQSNLSSNTIYEQKVQSLTTQLISQKEKQNTQFQQGQLLIENFKTQVEQLDLQLLDAKNKSKLYSSDVQTLQRSLAETQIRHPNDWILSEVEYLVNLAGRKLWLERDIPTTISLLAAADQRVVEMGDPSLNPLRRTLLEDINMLESLPKHDADSSVLALSSLERRIDKLVVVGLDVPDAGGNIKTEVSTNVGDWKENLGRSWQAFIESFIVISHRNTEIEALLTPQQAWYLKENLRNNLSKAEFAIYREQQDVYDMALQNSLQLIDRYYDMTDPSTQQFYRSLQDLSKQKVSGTYPDQFKSAPLLSRIIKQRISKSLINGNLE